MNSLKIGIDLSTSIVKLDYSEGAVDIILASDASLKGWGVVLMWLDAEGRRHPSRYESGL
jgi:hypothetical protein